MNQHNLPPDQNDSPPPIRINPQQVAVRVPTVKPYVTYVLMGLTILVYLLQVWTEFQMGIDYPAVYGAKVNELIAGGQFWRLITPVLLHGSILHIGFNMYALYLFGPRLERHFGHWRFLTLYLLSGFAGNVISMMFTDAISLGSSTAIFGLLGAQGVFIYQNQKVFGGTARRALNSIISVAVVNLVIGLSPGIDNWGHIGGLVGGTLFAWMGGPLLAVEGIYPALSLVDERDPGDVMRAVLIVGVFFGILTVGALVLRQ
jgi:rhomboid protease GluP